MKKFISAIFLVFSVVSCYQSAPDKSFDMSKVISSDSMVSLLTDLHLADGIISTRKDKTIPVGHLSGEYFEVILNKHQLDKEAFEESVRYYAYHSEELSGIYEKVITNLSLKESVIPASTGTTDTIR
jgi:hypothetical protein